MREKTPLKRMTAASVFAALIAVLSQLAIPTPSSVPLTLQTFAVVLAGACLGPLWGAISAAVYLALGVLGAPVFAGFGGGVGALVSYTGGFLLSFPAVAALNGVAATRKKASGIPLALTGTLLCHLLGVLWYSVVGQLRLLAAFTAVSLPYLGKDVLFTLGALYLAGVLKRRGIF